MPGFKGRLHGKEKRTLWGKHKARNQHQNLSVSAGEKAGTDRCGKGVRRTLKKSAAKSRSTKKTCLFTTADLEE